MATVLKGELFPLSVLRSRVWTKLYFSRNVVMMLCGFTSLGGRVPQEFSPPHSKLSLILMGS